MTCARSGKPTARFLSATNAVSADAWTAQNAIGATFVLTTRPLKCDPQKIRNLTFAPRPLSSLARSRPARRRLTSAFAIRNSLPSSTFYFPSVLTVPEESHSESPYLRFFPANRLSTCPVLDTRAGPWFDRDLVRPRTSGQRFAPRLRSFAWSCPHF